MNNNIKPKAELNKTKRNPGARQYQGPSIMHQQDITLYITLKNQLWLTEVYYWTDGDWSHTALQPHAYKHILMCIFIFCQSLWAKDHAVLFGERNHLLLWCNNSHNKLNKHYKCFPHHKPCVRTYPAYSQYLPIGSIIQRKEFSKFKHVGSFCSWFMQQSFKRSELPFSLSREERAAFANCTNYTVYSI